MKKLKKYTAPIFTLCAALCVIMALSGCVWVRNTTINVSSSPAVSDASLVTAGTLTVGINSTATPYAAKDSSGQIAGYDIDMAAAIADQMGLKVQIVDVNEKGAEAIASGKVDIALHMDASADATISNTDAYLNDGIAIFSLTTNTPASVASIDWTSNKVIGVAGTNATYVMQKALGVDSVVVASNINDAFESLRNGSANFLVTTAALGLYTMRNYSDVSFDGYLSQDTVTPIYVSIATEKTELVTAATQAIKSLNAKGQQRVITDKWFGEAGEAMIPGNTDVTSLLPTVPTTAAS